MLRYVLGFVLGVLFTSLIARADTRWKSSWYEELRVTVEALFYVEKYFVDTPDLRACLRRRSFWFRNFRSSLSVLFSGRNASPA